MAEKTDSLLPPKMYDEPLRTQLYEHLLHSELFSVYRNSYESITKHTLILIHPCVLGTPEDEAERCKNDYCEQLRLYNNCSDLCHEHTLDLTRRLNMRTRSHTKTCAGGISTSLIAITHNDHIIAYMRTGQVKLENEQLDIKALQERLNLPESVSESLQESFAQLRAVEKQFYVNQLIVLGAFALQLANLAEKMLDNNAPDSLLTERCKDYISKHLTEKICLDTLAEHTKVTNSYMCKQFKKHTGMTIVEYINFHRIKCAKTLLKEQPNTKVIDIAYECGFQSLSQFNRTFQRFASQSPSQFRKAQLAT